MSPTDLATPRKCQRDFSVSMRKFCLILYIYDFLFQKKELRIQLSLRGYSMAGNNVEIRKRLEAIWPQGVKIVQVLLKF